MFLLDPDDPGGNWKAGREVIRGPGGRKSPAGSRGRAPGVGLGGKAPKRWYGAPEAEQVLMIILLLNVIECELQALDLTVNSKKSCCLHIGSRRDINCSTITNAGCDDYLGF